MSTNRGLDNIYKFTKNNKEYILEFGKIKYIAQNEGHNIYRKILLEVNLYEISNMQKIKLNTKQYFKKSNLIKNEEGDLNDFELLGIKGVVWKDGLSYDSKSPDSIVRKAAFTGLRILSVVATSGASDLSEDEFKAYQAKTHNKKNWSWEGYTYWNKNMKQWRKDYLQESYRLPGVWCNNDVKVKDMDEYIEKKINFECQLINDIFDNFETN